MAPRRPQSATHFGLCLVSLGVGLSLVWWMAPWHRPAWGGLLPYTPLIPCLGILVVIATLERLRPTLRLPSAAALTATARRPLDLGRVAVRLCGLVATLALVALAYWLLPEYRGDFYDPYWRFLRTLAPLVLLVPLYFVWADPRTPESHDEYRAMGAAVLGGWREADRPLIARHLLGWAVKAFFLPLMTVYLSGELDSLYGAFQGAAPATMPLYQVFYHLSYAVDLLYCVVGYSAATRLFDTQIRSVEPTVLGWLAALICYQPFYSVVGRYYLQYDDNLFWDNWLEGLPALRACWAGLIVALASIYALCTVSFGLRFSNLTHRGIITAGPYRFSKHPAYLAKNLSWWLISVPFVSSEGWSAAVRNCCLLALLNGVYYVRARTEERHLSRDPTYVAYALWMNEHGLLRGISRVLPFLRYRAPAEPAEQAAPTEPGTLKAKSFRHPPRLRSDSGSAPRRRRIE
jgi:protein-S-isoprenylcysteine O-methyltransferase Ste14